MIQHVSPKQTRHTPHGPKSPLPGRFTRRNPFACPGFTRYTAPLRFWFQAVTGDFVSIDSSLRGKGRLARSRNVLKREERIAFLKAEDRWAGTESAFGLPKIRVMKSAMPSGNRDSSVSTK